MRRALMALALAAPAAPASPALGEEARVDAGIVAACFSQAAARGVARGCIGGAAAACAAARGETTLAIAECLGAETAAWDAILNREYAALRDDFRARDGSGALTRQLRDAQRAWIAFRDADCGLAYAIWAGGSLRVVAAGNCQLDKTARRAIELRDMRGD